MIMFLYRYFIEILMFYFFIVSFHLQLFLNIYLYGFKSYDASYISHLYILLKLQIFWKFCQDYPSLIRVLMKFRNILYNTHVSYIIYKKVPITVRIFSWATTNAFL